MTLYLEVKSIFLVGVGQHVNTVVPKCTVLPQKCTELNNKAKYIYIFFFSAPTEQEVIQLKILVYFQSITLQIQ